MTDRLISFEEVRDRVPFSKTHLYRKIAAGTFPRPVPLGPNKVAFIEREIDEWIASRLEARENQSALDDRRRRASNRSMRRAAS